MAILGVLAKYPEGCHGAKLCLLAGYTFSGSFKNALSTLRTHGFITGGNTERILLTRAGECMGPFEPLPEGSLLVSYWLNHPIMGKCERAILEWLVQHKSADNGQSIAAAVGYEYSGSFKNSLSTLRTAGLIVGASNTGTIAICDELNL